MGSYIGNFPEVGKGATYIGNSPQLNNSGGGGLSAWQLITASALAVNGSRFLANTIGGAFLITLPIAPIIGFEIDVKDSDKNFFNASVTLNRNGELIEGLAEDLILDLNSVYIRMIFRGGGFGWEILNVYN